MSNLIIVSLAHNEERYSPVCRATIPEYWVGTCKQISFGGNTSLLGEEYSTPGYSREDVIEKIKCELKSRGITGTLRIVE